MSSGGGSSDVPPIRGRSFIVHYLGASMMDSRCVYHSKMMPWVIAEILRFSDNRSTVLLIGEKRVSVSCLETEKELFESHIWDVVKEFPVLSDVDDGRSYFALIFKTNDIYLHCRLFASSSSSQVGEILSSMKEASKNCGGSGPLPSSSSPHFQSLAALSSEALSFEVLYMGKLRMSCRKAPPTFIDDAIEKFASHERERKGLREMSKRLANRRSSSQEDDWSESGSTDSLCALPSIPPIPQIHKDKEWEEGERGSHLWPPTSPYSPQAEASGLRPSAQAHKEKHHVSFAHPLQDLTSELKDCGTRSRTPSGDSCLLKTLSLPVEPMRSRALSTGAEPRGGAMGSGPQVLDIPKGEEGSGTNRTMILLIGKNEMRIISPDAKTTLFSKNFRDIYHSAKGVKNGECFGFICRESGSVSSSPSGVGPTGFVAYVFSCQSESVAVDILQVLKQAFVSGVERKERQLSCEHCPMSWYCRLCLEVDGLSDEKTHGLILKRVDGLGEEDRGSILAKFRGADPQSLPEQNQLLMMLLRAHCESKQTKHIHDTQENRHEFLHAYLGGGAILMKAKRSLTNSFDQLVKKKPHQPTTPSTQHKEWSPTPTKSEFVVSESPLEKGLIQRPRSSTIGVLSGEKIRCEMRSRRGEGVAPLPLQPSSSVSHLHPPQDSSKQHSPIMNIFMKVGPSPGGKSGGGDEGGSSQQLRRQGSWRQAIFKRVVSPSTSTPGGGREGRRGSPSMDGQGLSPSSPQRPKRTAQEIRALWKTAIKQQILLIRMEKQNYMLKEKQEEVSVKRDKLGYKELGTCDPESSETWDLIMSQAQGEPRVKCELQLLNSALLRGIPKQKRGQVWQLFIEQRRLYGELLPPPTSLISYEQLLKSLTSHQHAILIDLGRTFPTHKFFSSPLGSGQLSLFNLLKGYSLLDPDVGYCQGLSFVAGLLLMHLEEEEAFGVLKYLMFELGGREHYKPDMLGLQVKMYQLTRLIHDHDSDLQLLLYHNDVLPSLYAAPWFLTFFASQFPTGFAVRVLDVVMLHGVDVLAKFALVLILDHKKELMECSGLEQVMEAFKHVVTHVNSQKLDSYLKQVLEMNCEKQLLTYAVEYSVMHDETFLAYLNEANGGGGKSGGGGVKSGGSGEKFEEMEGDLIELWDHVKKLEELLRGGGGGKVPERRGRIRECVLRSNYPVGGKVNGSCDNSSPKQLVRSMTLGGDVAHPKRSS